MSAAESRGSSLIELIIALSLASLVFVAITALFTPMIRTQVLASNGLRSQGEALLSLKSLNRDIARASEIYLPAASWAGDALSGCANYDSTLGGAIDSTQATQAFYYCLSGGNLYSYSAATPCPMTPPACGTGGMMVGKNVSCTGSCFTRPAGSSNVVELRFSSVFGETRQSIDTAVAFQGSNQ